MVALNVWTSHRGRCVVLWAVKDFFVMLQTSVETKGGPIQCLATHNVTRLGQIDILAADAHGTLIVVCGQQILSRQSLASHAVTCLQVQEDGREYELVS